MKAAKVSINKRGKKPRHFAGWPMAHRMNACARLKAGEDAYYYYQILLSKGIFENLWGKCPPFQIDSKLGGTAGVAEMLLQSHEGYIYPLPALPTKWEKGSFNGLVARGNFIVSLKWANNQITFMNIQSNNGGICRIYIPLSTENTINIKNTENRIVTFHQSKSNVISFNTEKGMTYTISF